MTVKFHFRKFERLRLLGKKFKFFIPLGIQIKKSLNYINTIIKLHSEKQQQFENLLQRIYNHTFV